MALYSQSPLYLQAMVVTVAMVVVVEYLAVMVVTVVMRVTIRVMVAMAARVQAVEELVVTAAEVAMANCWLRSFRGAALSVGICYLGLLSSPVVAEYPTKGSPELNSPQSQAQGPSVASEDGFWTWLMSLLAGPDQDRPSSGLLYGKDGKDGVDGPHGTPGQSGGHALFGRGGDGGHGGNATAS